MPRMVDGIWTCPGKIWFQIGQKNSKNSRAVHICPHNYGTVIASQKNKLARRESWPSAFQRAINQSVDAGHGCWIRQPTAKQDRVSARVDTVRSRRAFMASGWRTQHRPLTSDASHGRVQAVCLLMDNICHGPLYYQYRGPCISTVQAACLGCSRSHNRPWCVINFSKTTGKL